MGRIDLRLITAIVFLGCKTILVSVLDLSVRDSWVL